MLLVEHKCLSGMPASNQDWICGRRRAIRASDHEQNDRENRRIQALIHEDRRRTIHESSALVSIGYCVCQEILTENLNMRRFKIRATTFNNQSEGKTTGRVFGAAGIGEH